jgi:predicted nuclease with TOPRIM domain
MAEMKEQLKNLEKNREDVTQKYMFQFEQSIGGLLAKLPDNIGRSLTDVLSHDQATRAEVKRKAQEYERNNSAERERQLIEKLKLEGAKENDQQAKQNRLEMLARESEIQEQQARMREMERANERLEKNFHQVQSNYDSLHDKFELIASRNDQKPPEAPFQQHRRLVDCEPVFEISEVSYQREREPAKKMSEKPSKQAGHGSDDEFDGSLLAKQVGHERTDPKHSHPYGGDANDMSKFEHSRLREIPRGPSDAPDQLKKLKNEYFMMLGKNMANKYNMTHLNSNLKELEGQFEDIKKDRGSSVEKFDPNTAQSRLQKEKERIGIENSGLRASDLNELRRLRDEKSQENQNLEEKLRKRTGRPGSQVSYSKEYLGQQDSVLHSGIGVNSSVRFSHINSPNEIFESNRPGKTFFWLMQ